MSEESYEDILDRKRAKNAARRKREPQSKRTRRNLLKARRRAKKGNDEQAKLQNG